MPVPKVRLPLKATVLFALVLVMATVAASTVLLKVVPPELVMVMVPISVPTAPLTVTAPVVLMVRFDVVPPAVPETEDRLIALAIPVPTVKVAPSTKVAAPKVMLPVEVPPMVVLAVTLTGAPKFRAAVVAAVIVPATLMALGAVAVIPPVNAKVPVLAPKVTVPVLLKVTALVIVPVVAFRATL